MKVNLKHIAFCFLFWTPTLKAQPGAPSLQDLIERALEKDFALANKRLEIQSTNIDQQKLKEAYLPRIDFSAKDAFMLSSFAVRTHEMQIPQLDIDIAEGKNRFTATSQLLTAGVETKVLIYSGGKIPYLKKALAEKVNAQTALLEKDKQQIIHEVMMAYDQLALLKQVRIVLNESEKRLQENKKTADKAFGYGLITKYEHQKIEVAQAQLASKITAYNGKRELVLRQLHLLTDIEPVQLSVLDPSLIAFKNVTSDNSFDSRAELIALDAIMEANRFQIQADKTWFVPKIQAASSLGYLGLLDGHIKSSRPLMAEGEKLSANMPNLNVLPMFNIGIGLKWDLFDGREGRREIQKSGIELQKTQNEKKEVLEKLELNLFKNRNDLNVANAEILLREKQKQIADNALTQATREYRTGLIKSLQLIDAEDDYQSAALQYIQAIYDQRRAVIGLLQAKGELTIESIQTSN